VGVCVAVGVAVAVGEGVTVDVGVAVEGIGVGVWQATNVHTMMMLSRVEVTLRNIFSPLQSRC
jgi:hypothetical protein